MAYSFRKIGPDTWGVQSDEQVAPGTVVEVTLRNGATKQVTLGAFRVHQYGKFVYEVAPQAPAARETVSVGNLSGVVALFEKAKRHLKFPAIVVSVPGLNETIRINVAGERSNAPGSLNVVSVTAPLDSRGRKRWYGRVRSGGQFEKVSLTPAAIVDRLVEFAADPVRVASDHGRLTGRCCFCNIALRDERSTAVGYGSTCASNYGLPWGARPASFAEGADVEADMQRMEAEGDRAQTLRDERAKHAARSAMEVRS